jgi:alpha-glucosidase/alpha-D-xyloside xylohydrolase
MPTKRATLFTPAHLTSTNMPDPLSRREALKQLGVVGAGLAIGRRQFLRGQANEIVVAGQPVEISVASLSPTTARITLQPIHNGAADSLLVTGELVAEKLGRTITQSRASSSLARVRAGDLVVKFTDTPPSLTVETRSGAVVQRLVFDAALPGMSFLLGDGPLLGLGEGGPQFDRKGSADRMIIGQGGYHLSTHGTRAPIAWLVGTNGWAMFVHQPTGEFDFTGDLGKFTPKEASLPLDLFVVASKDPAVIMREYARITGLPEMPPRWAFGYLQSHRTLEGPEQIAGIARTMREKKLPCDALIYLGTEFAPSGWNTRNGEFTWHPGNFPEPRRQLAALHDQNFKVVVHVVIEGKHLTGSVADECTAPPLPSGRTPDNKWPPDRQVSCYWPFHKSVMDDGVDGWWPDQGDGLDGPSELNRHRMYWEGTQVYRPNERPFALHRNASAGVQRFGGLIWSGDVQSRWETLKTHVPVAINTGLTGLPYWGTDIGGFIPTTEYTGELFVRWFQFAAFCPVFRSHGRNWHLHLPWGWDGGDGGPPETQNFKADPAELHNPQIEPICRQYLELRYRLMPYLYTAVRETHDTGMPIMRALWLHHADDPTAVGRGDEYLWGRDILVAPVVEKGATSRRLYLPRGRWFDFWKEEVVDGGREIDRSVDLATTPLYVRAGAVVPMDPVRQYTDEPVTDPTTLVVYPGADGGSAWYEDDGKSFAHRRGDAMRMIMTWRDASRRLSLRLVPGYKLRSASPRRINIRLAGSSATKTIEFTGRPLDAHL